MNIETRTYSTVPSQRPAPCHPERRVHAKNLCVTCYHRQTYRLTPLARRVYLKENLITHAKVIVAHGRIPQAGVIARQWKQCRRTFPPDTALDIVLRWLEHPVPAVKRVQATVCPHKERKAFAHGLCERCYENQRQRKARTNAYYKKEYQKQKRNRRKWKSANFERMNTASWLRRHIPEIELRHTLRESSQWLEAAKALARVGRRTRGRGIALLHQEQDRVRSQNEGS
jgi:hypothetical protein